MHRTIVVFCVLVIVSCTLCSCAKTITTQKVGQHNVEIIETSIRRSRPVSSSLTSAPDGTSVFTYESGQHSIRLEGEVLTVNGDKYIIPKKDDTIRIQSGRVEINGREAKPQRP
jgi:hypothetical protein